VLLITEVWLDPRLADDTLAAESSFSGTPQHTGFTVAPPDWPRGNMQRRIRTIILLLAVTLTCFSTGGGAQVGDNKPFVLVVYADWCPYCQNLKPVLALMNERYRGRIRYVVFDVTSEASTAKSREQARSLGLEKFFDQNYVTTSLVVIRSSSGREVFRTVHDYDFHHYENALEQQLAVKRSQ
jgi:thiol-disulfide isomerase/thioredoxin